MYVQVRAWLESTNRNPDPNLKKQNAILFNMIIPCLEADRSDPVLGNYETLIQWPEIVLSVFGHKQNNVIPDPTDANVARLIFDSNKDKDNITTNYIFDSPDKIGSLDKIIEFINTYILPDAVVLPLGSFGADFNIVSTEIANQPENIHRSNLTGDAFEMHTQAYKFLEQLNINYNFAKNLYYLNDTRYLNLKQYNIDLNLVEYDSGNNNINTSIINSKNFLNMINMININNYSFSINLFTKAANPLEQIDTILKQSEKIVNTFVRQHYISFLNLNNRFSIANPDNNFHRVHNDFKIDNIPYENSKINIYYCECTGIHGTLLQSPFYQPFCNIDGAIDYKYETFVTNLKRLFDTLSGDLNNFKHINNILSKSHTQMTKSIYPIGYLTNNPTVPPFENRGPLFTTEHMAIRRDQGLPLAPVAGPILQRGILLQEHAQPGPPGPPGPPAPIVGGRVSLKTNLTTDKLHQIDKLGKSGKQKLNIGKFSDELSTLYPSINPRQSNQILKLRQKTLKQQKLTNKHNKQTQKRSLKVRPIMDPLSKESFEIVQEMLIGNNPIAKFINHISVKPDPRRTLPSPSYKFTKEHPPTNKARK